MVLLENQAEVASQGSGASPAVRFYGPGPGTAKPPAYWPAVLAVSGQIVSEIPISADRGKKRPRFCSKILLYSEDWSVFCANVCAMWLKLVMMAIKQCRAPVDELFQQLDDRLAVLAPELFVAHNVRAKRRLSAFRGVGPRFAGGLNAPEPATFTSQ